MSGSGGKRIEYNQRERAMSEDNDRAQSFVMFERSELMRFMVDLGGARAFDAGDGLLIGDIPATVGTPLRADIFNGLVVEPQVGTANLYVSPGFVGLMDPDGLSGSSDHSAPNADDSPYKLVRSVGIQTNALLVVTANAGPGSRVDVVECRRKPEQVVETASRDVLNTVTGVATPATVDKVLEDQLEFRVRNGVQGAGYPGNVQGWLPLCILHTASGSGATVDSVDFWDVRPFVGDRVHSPYRSLEALNRIDRAWIYGDKTTSGGENRIGGDIDAQLNGQFAGGRITRGIPGADQNYIDALSSLWWESGFAASAGALWYLYLVFPYSLPRWVRYNRTAIGGKRYPNGVRGIPMISNKAVQTNGAHKPGSNLNVPTFVASVGAVTTDAVAVASGFQTAAGPDDVFSDGEWQQVRGANVSTTNVTGSASDEYTLTAGTHFPHNARAVRVRVLATFTGVQNTNLNYSTIVRQRHPASAAAPADCRAFMITATQQFDVAGTVTVGFTFDLMRIPPNGLSAGTPDLTFSVNWNATGSTGKSTEQANIIAWKVTH